MRHLHEYHPMEPIRSIWFTPVGGNSRYLSTVQNNRYAPIYHVWDMQRGLPPPINPNDDRNYRRRNWVPYNYSGFLLSPEFMLTPVCGRLNSRAQRPHLSPLWWERAQVITQRFCPRCRELRPNATLWESPELRSDPWNLVAYHDRVNTIDPISGR